MIYLVIFLVLSALENRKRKVRSFLAKFKSKAAIFGGVLLIGIAIAGFVRMEFSLLRC